MAMPEAPRLHVLPGTLLVLFLVRRDAAVAVLALPPARFAEGLKAACDLLRFGPVLRDEDRLDEILPWTGNV